MNQPLTNGSFGARAISELLSERFVIPSYQRGYRWTERQVFELLDDIREFQRVRHEHPKESFYCLQPVVVLPREDGGWELIDGQQRLTSISLVLNVLAPLLTILEKKPYSIEYETRPQSAEFLKRPDPDRQHENVDFFHMYHAYKSIERWFADLDGTGRLDFLNCLLAPAERNVRVIWYELPPAENAVQVFVRLNVGKIPLTNAELVRALFLRERNFDQPDASGAQLEIAHQWDAIEKQLQRDEFWYFINDEISKYSTRIEYLFEIKITERNLPLPQHDSYATFIAYQGHFSNSGHVDELWREIRQLALRLDEWFSDRVLYHLIGYWITVSPEEGKKVIVGLLKKRYELTRKEFEDYLKGLIFNGLTNRELSALTRVEIEEVVSDFLGELTYGVSRAPKIKGALLLFNVATLLRNKGSNLRFPFDLYKKQSWDIEHIRSVKSDRPERRDDIKGWLNNVLDYWGASPDPTTSTRDALRHEGERVLGSEPLDIEAFRDLYDRILAYFGEANSTEADHGLANLTLLDMATNRSYKNAVFPIKRARILQLDKEGTFAPLCTTNVFLKYYSPSVEHMMFWREDDGRAYQSAIVKTLAHFFSGERQ